MLLDSRKVSAVELTRAALDRIGQVEDRLKAFVTVTGDLALDQARKADRRIADGRAAPLRPDHVYYLVMGHAHYPSLGLTPV